MKQEEILDWMLEQGIVEDINVAKEFADAVTQEQLDSFGDAPVIVVGCMWEGWKLAKAYKKALVFWSSVDGSKLSKIDGEEAVDLVGKKKQLEVGRKAVIIADSAVDGCPLEDYGLKIGDIVVIESIQGVDTSHLTSYICFLQEHPNTRLGFLPEELEVI